MEESKNWSLRRQITEHFREGILSGNLAPGSVIPPSNVVAQRFGTSTGNVHRALSLLVAEGLISRRSKTGTVVNEQRRELKCIGFSVRESALYRIDFVRLLAEEVRKAAAKRNIDVKLIIYNCTPNDFSACREALMRGEVQGLITNGTSEEEYKTLLKLQAPFALISGANYRNRVNFRPSMLLDSAFESFRRRGCRKVGFIAAMPGPPFSEMELKKNTDWFMRGFIAHAEAHGMKWNMDWMSFKPRDLILDRRGYERLAYDAFKRIWSCAERPDGLFVYPDELNIGTLMGILHRKVEVPRDLQLVLHRNKGLEQLMPLPVEWIEVDVAAMAEGLITQLLRCFNGETTEPICVDCRLIEQSNT